MPMPAIQSYLTQRREDYLLLIARLFMASLFLFSGCEKVIDFDGASAFAARNGVPFAPYLMPFAILLELSCAILLVLGWRAREAALVLAAWMFVLNPWFHQFWTLWGGPHFMWQLIIDSFFHHFVMIGGMIYVVVFGPGRLVVGRKGIG